MLNTPTTNINERDFFKSLSKLAEHYGFTPINTKNEPYPYNVHLAYHHAKKQFNQNEFYADLRVLKNEEETYLSVEESFYTKHSLYHLPIKPLYLMLRDKKTKPLAELFLSVYAYFYKIGVPYYRDDDFLCYRYELLTEWTMYNDWENEEDRQEQQKRQHQLQQAEYIGDWMYQKIKNPQHLDGFEQRLDRFKPKNDYERACKQLAQEVFYLYQKYPTENLYRYSRYSTQAYEEYETITMDKYIGFVATAEDWLSNQMVEILNNEFNECTDIEEPTIYRNFNADFNADFEHNRHFDFENRLFESILNTYELLTYPSTQND